MLEFLLTPPGLTLAAALVGAAAAILGQLSAGVISIAKDVYLENRRNHRSEALAAIEALSTLERLVDHCHNIVHDRIQIAPDDPLDVTFDVKLPSNDMLDMKNLDRLDIETAMSVAVIKSDIIMTNIFLSSLELVPPHYNDVHKLRRVSFARIGLRCCRAIEGICGRFDLKGVTRPIAYQPQLDFSIVLEETLEADRLT